VVPGDQMILDVEVLKHKRSIWKFKAEASVDGKVVASAELMCAEQEIK
jgi:3-hydroxyacyl-[acyl-carrier-protein] dehydratase